MEQAISKPDPGVYARLSRFALCIATSSTHAYSALEAVAPIAGMPGEESLRDAFRTLLAFLDDMADERHLAMASPPNSIVARFSFLPYHQRVAFALVVIEEFPIEEAADIMDLGDDDVRSLLLATRDFLFASRWTTKGDA